MLQYSCCHYIPGKEDITPKFRKFDKGCCLFLETETRLGHRPVVVYWKVSIKCSTNYNQLHAAACVCRHAAIEHVFGNFCMYNYSAYRHVSSTELSRIRNILLTVMEEALI